MPISSLIPSWAASQAPPAISSSGHLHGAALHHQDRRSPCPATTMSTSLNSSCWNVGFSTHWPWMRPIRTAGDRLGERDLRHAERQRGAEQAEDVRVVLLVRRRRWSEDLGLVLEAVREQRPDAAGRSGGPTGLLLAGTALTLDEAARDTCPRRSSSPGTPPSAGRTAGGSACPAPWPCTSTARLPVLHQAGAVRLPCHAPRLEDQRASRELRLDSVHSLVSFSFSCLDVRSGRAPRHDGSRIVADRRSCRLGAPCAPCTSAAAHVPHAASVPRSVPQPQVLDQLPVALQSVRLR